MTRIARSMTILLILGIPAWSSAAIKIYPYSAQTTSAKSSSSTHSENSLRTDDNQWHWKHSDNGIELEVKIRGRVEFAEDYSDVTNISDGGSIMIIDERSGATHKFEAKSTAGGIQRSYWINGASHQFDREASSWLAKVLDDTVRQGGYDARPRVQRILRQGGPNAVLQEITRLKGDYVKRVYFDELLENGKLDDRQVREVLRQAAAEIHSDYEKAQLLIKMSQSYVTNDSQRNTYVEGVNTLHSDYEKGRALSTLLQKGNLSHENMLFALRAVKNISSDYERAQILIKIADEFTLDDASRTAYLEAVSTLRSDYEKGRVFSSFLKKGQIDKKDLLFVLKSAPGIESDYERAQLLIKLSEGTSLDESARVAYVDAVASIKSDYEKGRALAAFVKKGEPAKETLLLAVRGAANMNSDYEKAQFLIKVASAGSNDEAVRTALVEAARSIRSDYERGRVLSAVIK